MTESHADQASPVTDGGGAQVSDPAAPEQPYPSDGPVPPAVEEGPGQEPDGEGREESSPGRTGDDPARPAALGVERRPTGHAEVDICLARLADGDHLPVQAHLEVYEDVHRELRDTLTALDTRTGPPVPGPAR